MPWHRSLHLLYTGRFGAKPSAEGQPTREGLSNKFFTVKKAALLERLDGGSGPHPNLLADPVELGVNVKDSLQLDITDVEQIVGNNGHAERLGDVYPHEKYFALANRHARACWRPQRCGHGRRQAAGGAQRCRWPV